MGSVEDLALAEHRRKVAKVMSGHKLINQGYVLLYQPWHPGAHRGLIYEHRVVAERTLGRFLSRDEQIHHRNGIKSDNRPENLQVLSAWSHAQYVTACPVTPDEIASMIMIGYTYDELHAKGIPAARVRRVRKEYGFPKYRPLFGHPKRRKKKAA